MNRRSTDTSKSAVLVIYFMGVCAVLGMVGLMALIIVIIYVARAKTTSDSVGLITACAGMLAGIGTLTGQAIGSLSSMLSSTANQHGSVTVDNAPIDPVPTAPVKPEVPDGVS